MAWTTYLALAVDRLVPGGATSAMLTRTAT
jgi:hypothetical protein